MIYFRQIEIYAYNIIVKKICCCFDSINDILNIFLFIYIYIMQLQLSIQIDLPLKFNRIQKSRYAI